MNILIPDSWLREYLSTKATPAQIKEYLSLSGPSIERMHKSGKDVIYDIEVTGNRPDAMSVVGVAREAAAILPRFGIAAKLMHDPYELDTKKFVTAHKKEGTKKLTVKSDPKLNPRWTSIVLTNVKIAPSPTWLAARLEATGIRPVNNVVDITNYLMRAYGQPAHAFDYDEIKGRKMTLRASRPGEKLTTLDGKTHKLPGGDIVIADGDGRLIDLCGIMGGASSSIKNSTTNVVLFMQTYNATSIRKTSMALAHRTEAASLFEKGLDPELVLPTVMKGVSMMEELTGGHVASRLYDLYPTPYKTTTVSAAKAKVDGYIGQTLADKDIQSMLAPLGFETKASKDDVTVSVPSFRQDVKIDVDIIEEIARMYGYHTIQPHLPDTEPPVVLPGTELSWEQEVKIRLRDWGFTELYTYSMISEKLMDICNLDRRSTYKITNPLSEEWIYLRPTLLPSMLMAIKENLKHTNTLKLFELSMIYEWRPHDLPLETPVLMVAWTGQKYREAKGIGEVFGNYGSVTEVDPILLQKIGISEPVTIYSVPMHDLVKLATATKTYTPIPKYPPVIEDFSFVVPADFQVQPLIDVLSKVHPFVTHVALLDAYENKRTFRVTYSDPTKTLTNIDIAPVRQKLIEYATEKFGVMVSE